MANAIYYTQGCGYMLELQLVRIMERMPDLLCVIDDTIHSVYREVEQTTRTMRNDPLAKNKIGYLVHAIMEHRIRVAIEEANIPQIELMAVSNGRSATHLEIVTPYAIIAFSHVQQIGNAPRKAKYRQKYIDQMFMQEVYPELSEYTPYCKPLYIVTYATKTSGSFETMTKIGRLTVDQESWSCNYTIYDLIATKKTEEIISNQNNIAPHEEVVRNSKIQLKNQ